MGSRRKGSEFHDSRRTSKPSDQVNRRVVKGRDILGEVLSKKRVTFIAGDKAGKTALTQILFRDLWKNGRIPLHLSGSSIDAKWISQMPKHLERIFEHQYSRPTAARYWHLPVEDRAVLIDDYHRLPSIKSVREKLLHELSQRFGMVIVVGGLQMRILELADTDSQTSLLVDFDHYEMLGAGHRLKSELIRKWCLLGRAELVEDEDVERQTIEIEKVISIVVGRDLLPPYPLYVLLLLQQLELRRPIDMSSASHGKLHQAFITICLEKRRVDIETGFSYLSELACRFFANKVDHIDDLEAIQWHIWYVAEYKNPIDFAALRDNLVRAGILSYRNGMVRFRVKAWFYFFVANYLSSRLSENEAAARVKDLTTKLYRDDASNIVLFLCHLNRDSVVLDSVLTHANGLFAEHQETDLETDVKFAGELIAKLAIPELPEGNPEKHRQAMLEARDSADVAKSSNIENPDDEMYSYRHEDETESESEQRRDLAQINDAMKRIQITGQIVRSFAGSLRGPQKDLLANSCYSLGLRLLRFMFDMFRFAKDDFVKVASARYQRRFPDISSEESVERANRSLFILAELVVYSVVRHVALSIGLEKLGMVFADVLQQRPTIAVRTIDTAIKLEHFKAFPEDEVIGLFRDVKDSVLMRAVVQHIVIDKMYYFRTDRDVRQRVCDKVEIRLLPSVFDKDQKRD